MDEATLVRLLRGGDPAGLEALYAAYYGRVQSVVRRFVRDEWDAEEVVQDVFWTVHRKIHLFREDSALWSWMYRIAVNAARMRIRTYRRNPIPMEDELLRDIHTRLSGEDLEARPDQQLLCKRIVTQMQQYLEECTDTNRQLFLDMEVGGKSKEEVAAALALTVPAVKTRLHRVRVGLRDWIAQSYPVEPTAD